MRRWTILISGFLALFGTQLIISFALADEHRLSVPVAFGRGLNTIGPGNVMNHAILPQRIKVDQGGVVHFLVAGSHVVTVYNPGTKPEDIVVPPPPPPFTNAVINDPTNRYYLGIIPPDPPGEPFGNPPTINPQCPQSRGICVVRRAGNLSGDMQRPQSFPQRHVCFRGGKETQR